MGRIVAEVIKAAVGENAFRARMRRGGNVGSFASMGAAQAAANRSFGAKLRWQREDLVGEIERYVGRDPSWWPLDLGERLVFWLDSDQGVIPTLVGGSQRAALWNSFDPSGTASASQTSPSDAPLYVAGGGPNGLSAVRFTTLGDSDERLATDVDIAAPFVASVVASHRDTLHADPDVCLVLAGQYIRVSGGIWQLATDGGNVNGGAVSSGVLTVITVVHDGTNATLIVNGITRGHVAVAVPTGDVALSVSGNAWGGDIMSVVLSDVALPNRDVDNLIAYQQRRYSLG